MILQEDRIQFVEEINGIGFINDSKSVSVGATKWALEQFTGPIILIAGGKDRKDDFMSIKGIVREKVKKMVLIGEAKDRLKEIFSDVVKVEKVKTMTDAVETAFNSAQRRDCILLSPMCPSFDMFRDFQDRADHFKKIVFALGTTHFVK